jgi:hypothetical protein
MELTKKERLEILHAVEEKMRKEPGYICVGIGEGCFKFIEWIEISKYSLSEYSLSKTALRFFPELLKYKPEHRFSYDSWFGDIDNPESQKKRLEVV